MRNLETSPSSIFSFRETLWRANLSIFFLAFLVQALGQAMAQSGTISGQAVAAIPTPDGAIIRWFPKDGVLPSNGFRLYRSGGKGQMIPIVSPQPKNLAVKAGWVSEQEYETLVAIFRTKATTNAGSMNKVLVSLKVLTNANWSKALGLYYVDSSLKPGTYSYRLVAVEGTIEKEIARFSITTGATPSVPAPRIEASTIAGKINLTWKRPPGNHFIAAYRVYRKRGDGPFEIIQPDPFFPNQTSKDPNALLSFTDDKLEPGQPYYYSLASVDAFGRESERSAVVAVDLAQSVSIRLPDLSVKSLNKAVQLEWTPLDPKRVQSVFVLRGTDPDKPFSPIKELSATVTRYTDSEVSPGVDYYYALALKSGSVVVGPGPMETLKVLNLDPPAVPAALKTVAAKDQVQLSWTPNRESDLWGYIILRSDNPSDPLDRYIALNGTPISTANYTDKLPGSQASYVYRVVAVNTSNVRSKPSEAVRGSPANLAAPVAPQLLGVTPAEGSITLHFALGYVPDLAKLEVYRNGELIATLKPDANTFIDTKLKAEVAYTYTLRSVDTGDLKSPPSNELMAKALDLRPPSIPDVQGVVSPGGVRLVWKAEPGVKYIIFRLNENNVPIQISDPQTSGTFSDPDGVSGSSYLLKMLDASGNLSTSKPIVVR